MLQVGTLLVPQAVSYAQLADVPAINGLYTAAVPMLVYSMLAASKQVQQRCRRQIVKQEA